MTIDECINRIKEDTGDKLPKDIEEMIRALNEPVIFENDIGWIDYEALKAYTSFAGKRQIGLTAMKGKWAANVDCLDINKNAIYVLPIISKGVRTKMIYIYLA